MDDLTRNQGEDREFKNQAYRILTKEYSWLTNHAKKEKKSKKLRCESNFRVFY